MKLLANLIFLTFTFTSVSISIAAESADLVIINADIRTMARTKPRAQALAVVGNRFVAVGTDKEISAFIGPRTKKIDAGGKLVLPGFNDAHVHFAAIGNKFSSIDLKPAKTSEEIAAMLADHARFLPKGRWILGGGWNLDDSKKNQLRKLADAVTPENPVFVYSSDGKSAFANGPALLKARISKRTTNPADGTIDRDADGEPNGLLSGSAMRLVGSLVPPDHTRDWHAVIETATNYAASLGVTSVQDMHSDELEGVYRDLNRKGKLKTRVYDCAPITSSAKLAAKGIKAASGDAMVRTGCVKYFSEGDETEAEDLQRKISTADKAGLQVMIHAIGSRANGIVLDAFEKTIKENGARDRRFRVEHAQNPLTEDLPRFARSKIIASMQPWLFFDGNGTSSTVFKKHQDLRTTLAFGSDASITEFNPLYGIYAAVSGPEAITVGDAVRAYTVGSAYAEFQENVKGSIEVGKLADFVILDCDIFAVDIGDLQKTRVVATIVDGKQVYPSK